MDTPIEFLETTLQRLSEVPTMPVGLQRAAIAAIKADITEYLTQFPADAHSQLVGIMEDAGIRELSA